MLGQAGGWGKVVMHHALHKVPVVSCASMRCTRRTDWHKRECASEVAALGTCRGGEGGEGQAERALSSCGRYLHTAGSSGRIGSCMAASAAQWRSLRSGDAPG